MIRWGPQVRPRRLVLCHPLLGRFLPSFPQHLAAFSVAQCARPGHSLKCLWLMASRGSQRRCPPKPSVPEAPPESMGASKDLGQQSCLLGCRLSLVWALATLGG